MKPRPIVFRLPGQKPVHRHFHRIAWLACGLALCVIVFGAFVRLSNAGLSCPDWPTCYGRAAWPAAAAEVSDHAASAIRPFDDSRAWREQVHRMLAGTLGVLVLVLALLAARRQRLGIVQVLAAAVLVAISIPLYMRGMHVAASLLAGAGELILLVAAVRWWQSPSRCTCAASTWPPRSWPRSAKPSCWLRRYAGRATTAARWRSRWPRSPR